MTEIKDKKMIKDYKKQEALKALRELCPRGATVYTIVKSVARSGMSRRMELFALTPKTKTRPAGIARISWHIAQLFGYPINDKGVRVDGCGMDMGEHVVSNLSMALYCQKQYKREDAYALRQEWL